MSLNPVRPLKSASATATQGSKIVQVSGGVNCSFLRSGSIISIGDKHLVDAVSGTVPDGNGNSTITLRDEWPFVNTTGRMLAFMSYEGLADAVVRLNQIADGKLTEYIKQVASVDELRTLPGTIDGQQISLTSYYAGGTTGGGLFKWDAASTATDDSGVTIAVTGVATGRWVRLLDGFVTQAMFGGSSEALDFLENPTTRALIPESDGELTSKKYVDNAFGFSVAGSVDNRPPSRSDNLNYPDSSIWQFGGKIWSSSRTSQGVRSGWVKINDPLGAVGKVVTSAAGVWWLSKVNPDYNGQCINVTNSALGTSIDIGFSSDGALDVNKLDSFLVGTKGLVNIWYDQSGNGHNLTSSGDNRPVITLADSLNGLRSIVFERSVIYNGSTIPDQFMVIPETLAGNSNSVSIATLCRFSHAVRDAPIIQLNQQGNYTSFGKRNQNGIDSIVLYQNSSARVLSQVQPSSNPYFTAASLGSGAPGIAAVYTNDAQQAAGTSLAPAAYTGGKVGGSDALFVDGAGNPQNGGMLLSGLMIFNKPISLAEYRNLYRASARDFDLKPQIKGSIVCDGDSITEGAFSLYFNNWPRLMEDLLQYKSNIHLAAISGGTVVTQNLNKAKWQGKIFSANNPYNLIIAFMGTNDLAGGATALETYANLTSYISDVKSEGYDVIVCTCLPRQSFLSTSAETERLAYNQLIVENWQSLGCADIVDFSTEGTMGRADLTSNTSFYVDGTHPTQLGLNLIATFIAFHVDNYILNKLK